MNSKQIGNIGEAKVLSKFIELGFPVYLSLIHISEPTRP